MTTNDNSLNLDVNDILNSMGEQIAKQAQDIAVLNATIAALKKANEATEAPSES